MKIECKYYTRKNNSEYALFPMGSP